MRKHIHGLGKSFAYAFRGVAYCVKNERNMRIHIIAFAYVTYFAVAFYGFSRAELALLALTCALVIALEAVNTAVERLTDALHPEVCDVAKHAKDAAAGAVLIAAVAAAVVGVALFWDVATFAEIAAYFAGNIFAAVALGASVGLSVAFIFWRGKKT